MKRPLFFSNSGLGRPKKIPGATLDVFSALSGGVMTFRVRFEIFEKFSALCFLAEKRKPEPTPTENVISTRKSLRSWFSYSPIRVQIGPRRKLEKNREVGLFFFSSPLGDGQNQVIWCCGLVHVRH